MSHVVNINVEIKDLQALKQTCKDLGLTFKENQKTYAWWGQYMGDSPLPEGFTKEDLGKCEHAIGVPGTDWEIGVAKPRNGQGYRILFDYYGHQGRPILEAVGGHSAPKLRQYYAANKAEMEAKRKGYQCQRVVTANGTIKIVVNA